MTFMLLILMHDAFLQEIVADNRLFDKEVALQGRREIPKEFKINQVHMSIYNCYFSWSIRKSFRYCSVLWGRYNGYSLHLENIFILK